MKDIFKNMDKSKLVYLVLPILFVFAVLFLFVDDKKEAKAGQKDKEITPNYDVKEREGENKNATKLDLYREREKTSTVSSKIITDDDFYALGGEDHHKYENGDKEDPPVSTIDYETGNVKKEPLDEQRKKEVPKEVVKYVYVKEQKKQVGDGPTKSLQSNPEPEQKRTRERNSLIKEPSESISNDENGFSPVTAFIDNDNKLVKTGYDVDLLLSEKMVMDGIEIPAFTTVTGKASLSKDRVYIKIKEIYYNGKFISVDLEAYEPNGTRGAKVSTGSNQDIKEDVEEEILDQTSATVNVPVIGSLTVGSANKKKDEKGVILLDKHKIILK